MSTTRIWIAAALVCLTGALTHAGRSERAPSRARLGDLPYVLKTWTGRDAATLDVETQRVLAADSYLTRRYTGAAAAPLDLYIAYYSRQRPTVSIHSPLHCLPGTGWEPLDVSTLDVVRADGTGGSIRRLLVRKNPVRAVVLYWYSIHGRTLDGEVASKLWLLHDSVTMGRSDAALVRLVIPVTGDGPGAVDAAEREGVAFAGELLAFLPSLWS